jgi:hypothetical protein
LLFLSESCRTVVKLENNSKAGKHQ